MNLHKFRLDISAVQTNFYSFITQQVTNSHNCDVPRFLPKGLPLSSNNKWEAITAFAPAVLILIAVAAATVVLLGLLL